MSKYLKEYEYLDDFHEGVEDGFIEVEADTTSLQEQINNHVNSSTAHDDNNIDNTSSVVGAKVKDALNTLKGTVDNIVTGDSNAAIGVYTINDISNVNDYIGTVSGLTYFGGLKVNLSITNKNTGPGTLNINSLGAKSIKIKLTDGTKKDLKGNEMYGVNQLEYDGTDFILINGEQVEYSAPTNINSSIYSIPNTIKGQVSVGIKGQSVNQIFQNGDVETSVTSQNAGARIGVFPDGQWQRKNGFDSNEQQLNVKIDDKWYFYFRLKNTSVGKLRNGFLIRFSDGTFDEVSYSTPTLEYGAFYIGTKDLKANLKIFESTEGLVEREYQIAINMTANGMEDYTEEQMLELARMGYFEGVKSTVCALRLQGINKNLLPDFGWEIGNIRSDNGNDLVATNRIRSNYFRLSSSTELIGTVEDGTYVFYGVFFYDVNKLYIGYDISTSSIDQPTNAVYARAVVSKIDDSDLTQSDLSVAKPMLRDVTTSIEYAKHDTNYSYYYAINPETGKIIILNRVGSVYDEVSGGKLYKKIDKLIISDGFTGYNENVSENWVQAILTNFSDNSIQFDYNVNSNSAIAINNDYIFSIGGRAEDTPAVATSLSKTNLYVLLPRAETGITDIVSFNSYVASNPITLIYQLAEEKVYENGENGFSITGSLETFDGETTIIAEPYLRKSYTTYSSTITLDFPIESIDKLLIFQDGAFVETTGNLSSDGKTVTVSGAGTYHVEGVIKSEEHAGQELVISHPLNTAASIKSIGDLASQNASLISDHEWKLLYIADAYVALELGINQQGTTAERPVDANAGDMYFDTTLGKPVWYNGANWIDATGTIV